MRYTLDSLEHAEACIKETFNKKIISSTPILVNDFSEFGKTIENRFLFGRLTFGSNVDFANFYLEDNLIISIDPNSQIDMLFTSILGINNDSNNTYDINAQFRGFEIIVR